MAPFFCPMGCGLPGAHGKSFDFIHKGDRITGDAHVAAAAGEINDEVVLPVAVFSGARAILKEVRGG